MIEMNGAQSLIQSLADSGVEVCFGNPGTSEMHFVAALDSVPQMRAVLGLFEGAVTGAADGYARIAGKPAATLLHLGPGMANGLANLHNARRAHTPIVNIVGDHATYHHGFDAPLESNIDALTEWLEGWSRRSESTATVGSDAADAVAASMDSAGRIATLVLPADVSWGEGGVIAGPRDISPRAEVSAAQIDSVVGAVNAEGRTTLLLGGAACSEAGLRAASRIAAATGAQILVETFPAKLQRGAGLPSFERLGYFAEHATEQLRGTTQLVLAAAVSPVSFFAYPGKPSDLVPDGAAVTTLASVGDDVVGALEAVAELVAPGVEPVLQEVNRPALPSGSLDVRNWADVIGALLPDDAIISDEAATSGWAIPIALAGAPRHDVLTLTGGAIGQGIPVATGAAIAAPERPVINFEADGSAMYTITALWTQAREQLNVTTILLNNRAYAILRGELQRVGADGGGVVAQSMLDLSSPDMDYVKISEGLGVPASRASTAEELAEQFAAALAEPGPHLIEVMLPPPS
ncbi:acetolactate synthase large subunit [Rhodococcus erythropolis]|nr:acetolactate synthase large subunit [Rhodococcus erythropolis]UJC80680.1 acetolactate synthase large subunit [Rhodococcus erythropolis]